LNTLQGKVSLAIGRVTVLASVCVLGLAVGNAQAPAISTLGGYFQYSQADLRVYERSLPQRMNQLKQAAERLGDFGNHQAWIAHREANGLAEIHENWSDLMFIVSGEATLVVGGEIDNRYIESPGEVRGSGVRGGTTRLLREGDIVNVPAGMQHRFLVRDGRQVTFFTMKIAKPPASGAN
jgi:mannose-6-phosphate isomerase-like protein (cupin superfamily)